MNLFRHESKTAMGAAAAAAGAERIRDAITERGTANIIVATGASQFETIEALIRASFVPDLFG